MHESQRTELAKNRRNVEVQESEVESTGEQEARSTEDQAAESEVTEMRVLQVDK